MKSSFADYLRNAYWYIGIPPSLGTTHELIHQHTTHCLRVNIAILSVKELPSVCSQRKWELF